MTKAEALKIIEAKFPLVIGGPPTEIRPLINAICAYILAAEKNPAEAGKTTTVENP